MVKLLNLDYFFNRNYNFLKPIKYIKHKKPYSFAIKNFFTLRFFGGFYLLGSYNFFGCLKHWSVGMICTYVFPKYSKKNLQTLFRLCGLFGTAITNKINNLYYTKHMFLNNTVFTEFVANSPILKQKTWGRLNKIKRSLPRRSRKKIFISRMGRIWLS